MPNGNFNQQRNLSQRQGSGSYRGQSQPSTSESISGKTQKEWNQEIEKWIKNGINKDTITYADGMGKKLKGDGLTTSQIRNVFGEMRKIQMNGFEKEKANFLLLRPKLAYAAKRQNAKGMDAFYDLFCKAYEAVDSDDMINAPRQFDQLLQVMEAVLAYHKFYGGQ